MTIKEDKPKKIGRPKYWTDDRIDTLGMDLINWAKKEDSYALIQFCAQMALLPDKFSKLAKENEEFRQALYYAKSLLADRMLKGLNCRPTKIHPAYFNRYIRFNDILLDEHLKEIEKDIGAQVGDHIIKITDFSKYKKSDERDIDAK